MISKGRNRRFLAILLVMILTAMTGCNGGGEAQSVDASTDDFPNQPITFIVNYDVGGSTDLSMRALCRAAEEELGQPITILNQAGGGGTAGIVKLQNSKNDGYTIGSLTFAPMTLTPHQMEVPYTVDDFDYIMSHVVVNYGIFVTPDSKYQTMEELIDAANAGERITFSCPSITNLIPIVQLRNELGIDNLETVTFESDTKAITAVMGGHVDAACIPHSGGESFLQSGEMLMIGSVSKDRFTGAPDAPTLLELGYNVEISSRYGVGAPKGVPENRLEILRDAFAKAFENQAYQEQMAKLKNTIEYQTGDEFEAVLKDGYEAGGKIIKELGI